MCFIEEEFGFTAHMLEMNVVELYSWRRLLPSEKNTIVLHATASHTDCGYLIARSEAGRAVHTEWVHDCSIVAQGEMAASSPTLLVLRHEPSTAQSCHLVLIVPPAQ